MATLTRVVARPSLTEEMKWLHGQSATLEKREVVTTPSLDIYILKIQSTQKFIKQSSS